MLTPFVPRHGANPGREVHEPDTAFRGVLVLPPGTTGAEGLDSARSEEFLVVGWNRHRIVGSGHGDLGKVGVSVGMELTWGNEYSRDSWPLASTLRP